MSELKINYLGTAPEADIGDRRMNSQWKLVPVEPTETMVINGFESEPNECFTDEEVWEQYQEMSGCQQAAFRAKLCWAVMLASAPEPPPADAGEVPRLTVERDALHLRLNAADQRIDELEGVLQGLYRSGNLSVRQDQLVHATLSSAPQPATAFGLPVIVDPTLAPNEVRLSLPVDPERERLTEIIERYPNGDPLEYNAALRKLQQ